MRLLMLKEIPGYEQLRAVEESEPEMDLPAVEAYLHILRAGDEFYRVVNEHLKEVGLSKGGFTLMLQLYDRVSGESERTPGVLADTGGVRRATITGLLDTLEKGEFIVRKRSNKNRREVLVSLTDKGRGVMEATLPRHCRLISEVLGDLTHEEKHSMVLSLRKVIQRLEESSEA